MNSWRHFEWVYTYIEQVVYNRGLVAARQVRAALTVTGEEAVP